MSNEWFHVKTPYQEYWLYLPHISSVETPGETGKPAGWHDGCAAAVSMQGRTDVVVLNAEQWAQLKRRLNTGD